MKIKFFSLLFLICFLLQINAQTYQSQKSLNESFPTFGDLSLEEMLFDPHYDEHGKLKSYSIAGAIRYDNTYNSSGQLHKKTFYMLDNRRYIWNKNQETNYTYVDGRLVEETVYEWSAIGLMDIFQPEKLSQRKYILDPQRKTETIEVVNFETTSTSKMENTDVSFPDSTHIVRYLNKDMKPDSTHTYNIKNGIHDLVNRTLISYDEKQRRILDRIHFKMNRHKNYPTEMFLTDGIEYESAEYDNNDHLVIETDTTQTESVSVPEESWYTYDIKGEYKDREVVYTCIFSENKVAATMSVKYDPKGRIIAQSFTRKNGKETILDASFNYDAQGRTLIKKELKGSGFSFIEGPDTDVKYNISYDEQGVEKNTFYLKNCYEDVYIERSEVKSTYDGSNNLFTLEKTQYDKKGEFNDAQRIEHRYNERGLLVQSIDEWKNKKNVSYDYNILYDYDENAFPTKREIYSKYINENKWIDDSYSIYKYDTKGQIVYKENRAWEDGKWKNKTKSIYTYTPSGKKASEEGYYASSHGDDWIGSKKEQLTYNADDRIETHTFYEWISSKKSWRKSEMNKYLYAPHTQTSENYRWDDHKWIPRRSNTEIRNGSLQTDSYADWDDKKKEWVEKHRGIIFKIGDSIAVDEHYSWDTDLKQFVGIHKKMRQFDDKYYKFDITTRCKWNLKKKDWDFATRYSIIHQQKGLTINSLDRYDAQQEMWIPDQKIVTEYNANFDNVRDLYLWSQSQQEWIPQKRLILPSSSLTKQGYLLYLWDKASQKWEPLLQRLYLEDNRTAYYTWDEAKKEWVKKIFETEDEEEKEKLEEYDLLFTFDLEPVGD